MAESNINIPDEAIKRMARCILPEIQKFFESEEGKREYEEWLRNRGRTGKEVT